MLPRITLAAFFCGFSFVAPALAVDATPPDVILDEVREQLLGIDSAPAESQSFAETAFALGRIEVLPGKRAVVSTRIAGRAQSVIGIEDMKCEAGDELLWVESRQPGDPPPVIRVDAPIAGIIAKVNVAQGQPVGPDDSLMEIYDLSSVEAVAAVPEHLAGKLAKDQDATITISGYPDRKWEAKLAHLGINANPTAGTLEAAFHVVNEDAVLRPGMRAEFNIVTSSREDVTTVPRTALQGDAGGYFVFIRHYDLKHAFWKRPVVIGAQNDESVEIISGLNPGDEVITKGGYSLAFAGKGSISLKEALDAAHGHEHNEDGTEMTPAQKAARDAARGAAGGGSQGGGDDTTWKIISGVLGAVIVAQAMRGRKAASGNEPPSPPQAGLSGHPDKEGVSNA